MIWDRKLVPLQGLLYMYILIIVIVNMVAKRVSQQEQCSKIQSKLADVAIPDKYHIIQE